VVALPTNRDAANVAYAIERTGEAARAQTQTPYAAMPLSARPMTPLLLIPSDFPITPASRDVEALEPQPMTPVLPSASTPIAHCRSLERLTINLCLSKLLVVVSSGVPRAPSSTIDSPRSNQWHAHLWARPRSDSS
jgi:hypothetical protein